MGTTRVGCIASTKAFLNPARDQERGICQYVGVENPQNLVELGVQTLDDRRDGDVHDGGVEQGHEEPQAHITPALSKGWLVIYGSTSEICSSLPPHIPVCRSVSAPGTDAFRLVT
jgi:hypothetical protein